MKRQHFKESLTGDSPPSEASVYVKALWYDTKDDWNKSHELIQDLHDQLSYWIHAYLHRKEGDAGNADYWYTKARKKRPSISLDQERQEILDHLLE